MRRLLAPAAVAVAALAGGWFAHQPSTPPNSVDDEKVAIRASGFSCGVERWPVKTLADPAAAQINFGQVVKKNIPALRLLANDHPSARETPTETTVYRLSATHVVAFKQEPDSDIHLELRSPLPGNPTMIAEVPDPGCVTPSSDPVVHAQQLRIGAARASFLRCLQQRGITITGSYQTLDMVASISGVGFFDFDHGQRGVAPNAIELHPVLSFSGTC